MTSCSGHRSHIVDSSFFRQAYSTDEARRVFCDFRRLQRWLDVELALAASQAELGIIPAAAVQGLEKTARLAELDTGWIRAEIERTGHSLLPLLNAWQQAAGPDAGRYIHFGATTQDIQDTAQSLEIKEIIAIVERDLSIIIDELARLAEKYRNLAMVGRTHGQHALPTTLGLKAAVWLDELLRNADRLENCKQRVLVSQLFGGVGTMAAFGDRGLEILARFSDRLGLALPHCAWHTARDRQAELVSVMALLAGCLGKIANEICQLAKNEIAELEEPFHMGKIGSSTMPHKRNPELCEQVVVLARLIKANAAAGFDTLISEHERDYRAVRLEWVAISEASLFICAATRLMKTILRDLAVHEQAIRRGIDRFADLISSEALMFLIGNRLGKQTAHELIYKASMAAHESGRPLADILIENEEIRSHFTRDDLLAAIKPADYTGLAAQLTDRIVSRARARYPNGPDLRTALDCPVKKQPGGCPMEEQG